ncbi:MAG: GntR family transcriptional regulator [Opitutaceae bacterium]|nr:GntR family transcriptional regulator [Opitutaceae bacterium]
MPRKSLSSGTVENAHTNQACEFIRHKILSGAYPPGYRLKTIALAKESGVSRTPVREALRQLQTEGIVDIRPRLGACVREINFREFKEMCELRLTLESFSAELAATNHSLEDIVEIQDAFENMQVLVGKLETATEIDPLVQELAKQDIRFHLAILNAAGNSLLKADVLRLHLFNKIVNINFIRLNRDNDSALANTDNQERRRWVLECHRKIFEAIKARQPEAARQTMREHLKDIIDRSVIAMARNEKRFESLRAADSELFYAST